MAAFLGSCTSSTCLVHVTLSFGSCLASWTLPRVTSHRTYGQFLLEGICLGGLLCHLCQSGCLHPFCARGCPFPVSVYAFLCLIMSDLIVSVSTLASMSVAVSVCFFLSSTSKSNSVVSICVCLVVSDSFILVCVCLILQVSVFLFVSLWVAVLVCHRLPGFCYA